MADDPETRLMLRVAAGDLAAFEDLVARMAPRLHGFFRRLGADRTHAEDLAQEVFWKVYRARASYSARARFTTYLFHVARNHWIDAYRQKKARPAPLSADAITDAAGRSLAADLPGSGEAADEVAREGEVRRALARALERLPGDQREVFVLAQVEGLRYAEIAAILEIPVGTIKSRMHAAVRSIRASLSREGIEP